MDHTGAFFASCLFVGLLVAGICYPVMYHVDNAEIRARAIQMDKAYYDSKTGEFTWSDNVSAYIFNAEELK